MSLEARRLQTVASDGQLSVHPHDGFWTSRYDFSKETELNALQDRGEAPWRVWDDRTARLSG